MGWDVGEDPKGSGSGRKRKEDVLRPVERRQWETLEKEEKFLRDRLSPSYGSLPILRVREYL